MKLNGFQKYLAMFAAFGSIVNMDDETGDSGSGSGSGSVDIPGGLVSSDNTNSGKMGGSADTDGVDDGDKGKVADSKTSDGKVADTKSDDKSVDNKTPDYDSRFSALENNLNKLLSTLDKKGETADNTNSGKEGTDSFTGLEHEDLVAMMAEDPAGFIDKLTSAVERSVTEKVTIQNQNAKFNEAVEATIDKYAESNPDFEELWDKGTLQDFMDKNPGHNAISAHMQLTMEDRIAAAKKEGAEEAIRNFATKSNNQVLTGGHNAIVDKGSEALANPSKFGGRARVLAARAGITN